MKGGIPVNLALQYLSIKIKYVLKVIFFLLNLDILSCCVFVSSVHFHTIDFPAHYFYSSLCCSCLVQAPCFSWALYNVVLGCKRT